MMSSNMCATKMYTVGVLGSKARKNIYYFHVIVTHTYTKREREKVEEGARAAVLGWLFRSCEWRSEGSRKKAAYA